jgi:LDH2 family malate/lactate/ureidoglycolate dehydrogenase
MSLKEKIVKADALKDFSANVLRKVKVPYDEAEIMAEVLVSADLRGIKSHGVARLPLYVNRLKNGWIRPDLKLTVKRNTPISLHIDAENSLGQVVGYKVMKRCIEKAKKQHVGFAAVSNSNHFGIAGYYAMMALPENMIGICTSNSWPLVVPTFGAEPILGTNPLAVAVPTKTQPTYVLDMATSISPIGKMEMYQRHGKQVPTGWAIDEEGVAALDSDTVMRCVYNSKRGGLLPLGGLEETAGYKGYGLALLVDILSGVLSGGACLDLVVTPEKSEPLNIGHFLAAISIEAFTTLDEFKERMDKMINRIKNSAKAKGHKKIYIPGEKEWLCERHYKERGIPLYYKVYDKLRELARQLDMEYPI